MTTTYDRMRAAADRLAYEEAQHGDGYCVLADQLRADAERLEALEKEMRDLRIRGADAREEWADTLRGEQS